MMVESSVAVDRRDRTISNLDKISALQSDNTAGDGDGDGDGDGATAASVGVTVVLSPSSASSLTNPSQETQNNLPSRLDNRGTPCRHVFNMTIPIPIPISISLPPSPSPISISNHIHNLREGNVDSSLPSLVEACLP